LFVNALNKGKGGYISTSFKPIYDVDIDAKEGCYGAHKVHKNGATSKTFTLPSS